MTDNDLELQQIALEENHRNFVDSLYDRQFQEALKEGDFAETRVGSHLLRHYINPVTKAIKAFLDEANSGTPGKKHIAARHLKGLPPEVIAFLTLKTIAGWLGMVVSGGEPKFTHVARAIGRVIREELRLREFDKAHPGWSLVIHRDLSQRDLLRYRKIEYLQKFFRDHDLVWKDWTDREAIQIGVKMLDIFKQTTGDIEMVTVGRGQTKKVLLRLSEGLIATIGTLSEAARALTSKYIPMIVPPRPWSQDNLTMGGYLTHNMVPYPLVKSSSVEYKLVLEDKAKAGKLDTVFEALNAIQETPWAVNVDVLHVFEKTFAMNIEIGKMPTADPKPIPEFPVHLEDAPTDDPRVKDWRRNAAKIHEHNANSVAKRVCVQRIIGLARDFAKYPAIYFPHDLDSRGRAYPKPGLLNPQGPDYVKALLRFSEGKYLDERGLYWLAVHGANCWGQDKLPIDERVQWVQQHLELFRAISRDPIRNMEWVKADSPFQALAWCFEYIRIIDSKYPYLELSYIPVSLDATCSGIQHFSAMLRDEVGGKSVNMVPSKVRQDVYGEVAAVAMQLVQEDLKTGSILAEAAMSFGITRKMAKRAVMVKPYAGTRQSCMDYVGEAIDERLLAGEKLPVPKEMMWDFRIYVGQKVWEAIPQVVIAADQAMKYISDLCRRVAKSNPPSKRIEWTSPSGLPVYQRKMDMKSRQITTYFDGGIFRPRLDEETDRLDSRRMATSVPPSFVHSLDAAHMSMTISVASVDFGLRHFAVVHDSFGVHAQDVPLFSRIIRQEFVRMYSDHDVIEEITQAALPLITSKYAKDLPERPPVGNLDLHGILENEFFFS